MNDTVTLAVAKAKATVDPIKYMEEFHNFNFTALPIPLRHGYANWWTYGIVPGSFLNAVINNDLFKAVSYADDLNRNNILNIVKWFHNYADMRSIRSGAEEWRKAGGYFGLIEQTEQANS